MQNKQTKNHTFIVNKIKKKIQIKKETSSNQQL